MRTINDGFPIKQFKGIDIDTSIQSSSANYYTYSSRVVKFTTPETKRTPQKQMQHIFIMVHEVRQHIILLMKIVVINQLR